MKKKHSHSSMGIISNTSNECKGTDLSVMASQRGWCKGSIMIKKHNNNDNDEEEDV
jgi:hypothetical protein